jgi:hypothetical protein
MVAESLSVNSQNEGRVSNPSPGAVFGESLVKSIDLLKSPTRNVLTQKREVVAKSSVETAIEQNESCPQVSYLPHLKK